jgi:hypothetical protein
VVPVTVTVFLLVAPTQADIDTRPPFAVVVQTPITLVLAVLVIVLSAYFIFTVEWLCLPAPPPSVVSIRSMVVASRGRAVRWPFPKTITMEPTQLAPH